MTTADGSGIRLWGQRHATVVVAGGLFKRQIEAALQGGAYVAKNKLCQRKTKTQGKAASSDVAGSSGRRKIASSGAKEKNCPLSAGQKRGRGHVAPKGLRETGLCHPLSK